MDEQAESAVIVRVAEAEPMLSGLRQQYEPAAALGVPAHITLYYPFTRPTLITPQVLHALRQALARTQPFTYRLKRVGRFPRVVYLAPEPAEPFVDLIVAIGRSFPGTKPYRGRYPQIVPHLTVARGDEPRMDQAHVELQAMMARFGAIVASCSTVEVLVNPRGRWCRHTVLTLGHDPEG